MSKRSSLYRSVFKLNRRWFPWMAWGLAIVLMTTVAIPAWIGAMADAARRSELEIQRDNIVQNQGLIERLEKSDPIRLGKVTHLRSRMHRIGDDEAIRGQWLQLIRQHDGKIRQFEIRKATQRPWKGVTDSLDDNQYQFNGDNDHAFILHSQTIALKMEASFESVKNVVKSILADDPIAELTLLMITPTPLRGGVELHLEMRLHELTANESATNPMVARGAQEISSEVQF